MASAIIYPYLPLSETRILWHNNRSMKKIDLHKNLLLAVSDKNDGNIDDRFSPQKIVKTNRQKLFKQLKLKHDQCIEGQQVHGTLLLVLNSDNSKMWKGMNVTGVDGFVTSQSAYPLMTRVADCVPLVLYDPEKPAMGVLHVGWRGAVKNLHIQGLELLENEFGSDPKKIMAWIGPCARKESYLSKEKPQQADDQAWQSFIHKNSKDWSIDIPGYIAQTLYDAGMYKKNIVDSGEDTVSNPDYFSHSRASQSEEKKNGRFAVIAKLHTGADEGEDDEDDELGE